MDPISSKVGAGGLGNIANELSKTSSTKGAGGKFEAMRAEKGQGGDAHGKADRMTQDFMKTGKLDGQAQAPSMAERVAARDGISFQPNLQFDRFQMSGPQNTFQPQTVNPTGSTQQVASAVQGLNDGQARLESIIGELRSGKEYSQTELLGMQAEVNMLSEQVQMSTKLVDSAMQSIKSVMQQQV